MAEQFVRVNELTSHSTPSRDSFTSSGSIFQENVPGPWRGARQMAFYGELPWDYYVMG